MQKYILSVDNGGTNIKAVLFDIYGRQVTVEKEANPAIHKPGGIVEFDEELLWEINCRCIKRVIQKAGIAPQDICCIGFSGQGKGLYMVDDQGMPFRNAITSSDLRAEAYCIQWEKEGIAEAVFDKILQHPIAGQTAPILRWMKEHETENYKRIKWVFSMKDYLVFRMTGQAIAGKGCQSGTCLVNLLTQEYDTELLEQFGIEEIKDKLPPLVWDTQISGYVTEEAARVCGCHSGTPVSAGMFDVDASAVGMGIVNDKNLFMITGTCGVNGYVSQNPVTNGDVMFHSLYSLPNTYLIEDSSSASAGVLEWVSQILFSQNAGKELYEMINKRVDEIKPQDSRLIFLPLLNGFKHGSGEGSAFSRGAWIGLCPEHTCGEMLRAVYEGVAFVHKIHYEHLLNSREKPSVIKIAGGATNSKVWMQMFADILQCPVEVVEHSEMGAKGAAVTSAVAVGLYPDMETALSQMVLPGQIIQPEKENCVIYQKKFECFKKVLYAMEDVWPLIGNLE